MTKPNTEPKIILYALNPNNHIRIISIIKIFNIGSSLPASNNELKWTIRNED